MKRPHINVKTKLASALCHMLRPDEHGQWQRIISHDDAKRMTEDEIIALFDFNHHPILHVHGGPAVHWNLDPLLRADHRKVTNEIDIPRIAKGKRINRANDAFVNRLLAKDRGEPKPRSRWGKRKLRSRAFEVRA